MDKSTHPLTLLGAEDDDDLRELMAETPRSEGYAVIEARDERQWSGVLESRSHFDMVLADVGMPGRHDGMELVQHVRQQRHNVPILLITGRPFEDVTFPEGAGYLAKPFAMGKLLRYVAAALQGVRGAPKDG